MSLRKKLRFVDSRSISLEEDSARAYALQAEIQPIDEFLEERDRDLNFAGVVDGLSERLRAALLAEVNEDRLQNVGESARKNRIMRARVKIREAMNV